MAFLFSLLVLGLMVFALVDIIRRDDAEVRHLPKVVWVVIVIIIPLIGSALWFTLGRTYPEGGVRMPRPTARPATAPAAPAPETRTWDRRTTEQQLADLEKEIEEDRLREELARRRREGAEEA